MEFLAATKDGIIIYDLDTLAETDEQADEEDDETRDLWARGVTVDGQRVRVVARIPSPPNAFGHTWSADGKMLASVSDDGVAIMNASQGYERIFELPKVSPDVGGRAGGVRKLSFSPGKNYIVTYEKWDPQYPDNVHVWDLRPDTLGSRLQSSTLRGYTSGGISSEPIKWTFNESHLLELKHGEGLRVVVGGDLGLDEDELEEILIEEKGCTAFEIAPASQKDACYVACYTPESGGRTARVAVYHLLDPSKKTAEVLLPTKVKDCKLLWNGDGTALLVLATSDVDETGSSYFGSSYLYWILADGKRQTQVCGAKDGLVQDLAWSPGANEFMVIVGMLPAKVCLYNGSSGRLVKELGEHRRNTLKWNPFGRFVAVGGFGTLPGDVDLYDRSDDTTISSFRAALTVDCAWSGDGRQLLACTVAPRMNEGNQLSIYKYTGERLLQIEYKPSVIEGRHEDTGAGARTKTQALLFAASWRPTAGEDRPATPRPGARKRRGLPEAVAAAPVASAPAYRPRGAGGGSVAAMMRGEVDVPPDAAAAPASRTEGWGSQAAYDNTLTAEELRQKLKEKKDAEKAAKKAEEEAAKKAKEDLMAERKKIEKGEENQKKLLAKLKEDLQALEVLKDKGWDELTEEDEEQLEGEMDLLAQIAELEKTVGNLKT